jgi:hypothetical protein
MHSAHSKVPRGVDGVRLSALSAHPQVWASAPAAVALRKEAHVKRCLHELNHSQNITSRLITNLMTLLQDTVTTESDSSGVISRFAATYLSSIFVVPILPWLMVRPPLRMWVEHLLGSR